ncbi:metal-dependent phosphoesterase [Knoellia sinensis KCTC 19936]|uniref:Metal-dependent phosphoesterase n=1 Tax=Knoellia sinensis KCTC 19936 TaxID=1385520 RepID=A0A0A0JA24_9MICO|nr:PHP domain-containing protein [Knoellia sinensis]KGN33629.1 metal-dependent phosphoesterase [Knoellia sinensis KCTC 19936]
MKIDLHTHSTASDGTQSPSDLVAEAKAAGLGMIALTDHDTTAGWEEAVGAAHREGIRLVRGIEISCSRAYRSIHLLGYLPNPDDPRLAIELARARDSRVGRMDRMVQRMAADGIPITVREVRAQVAPGATLGRPHLADALVANGVVATRDEAFRDLLHDGSKYYVGHYAPDPVAAIKLVRGAGGVPVLAHPFAMRMASVSDEMVEEFAEAGLAGLEAHHRDHEPEEVERALRLAERHKLVVTGSSDYHGTGKLNRLGENTTKPREWSRIVEQSRGVKVIEP